MSDTQNPETDVDTGDQATADPPVETTADATTDATDSVDVQSPEYQELKNEPATGGGEISRFHDLKVTLTAELGKTTIPLERLLQLGPGSVVELDRAIDSPVELLAQGVPVACGDVVVVDDRFAIRISDVYSNHPNH